MRNLWITLLVLAGCGSSEVIPIALEVDGTELKVSGPYLHRNLAVYLIHHKSPDNRDFITLDEGLKDRTVAVTEKEKEEVGELIVENKSSQPLFLQEGDRLRGGKQDRIVGISMVIPPNSGRKPIPTFCVEQNRWSKGGMGARFETTGNNALASNTLRMYAKVGRSQDKVWEQVAEEKQKMQAQTKSPNSNSSLNEMMDSEQAVKASKGYSEALQAVLDRHPDAVGVAFCVGSEIQEINIYPGQRLLRKVYPRLLASYAIMATMDRKAGKAVRSADIIAFMNTAGEEKETNEEFGSGNVLKVKDYARKVKCDTLYKGKSIHRQWLKK